MIKISGGNHVGTGEIEQISGGIYVFTSENHFHH